MTNNLQQMIFESKDWQAFQSLETLTTMAGVSRDSLYKLVMKELADNALDVSERCRVGTLDGGGYYVEDNGNGIAAVDIEKLFSLSRPLRTTKSLRLLTRGCLGNGLRVVVGAVYSSGGELVINSQNYRHEVRPQPDGKSIVTSSQCKYPKGTRIEIKLGRSIPDRDSLRWARQVIAMSEGSEPYRGKTSPWWYCSDSFFRLLQTASDSKVKDLIKYFDGCSKGQVYPEVETMDCKGLSKVQSDELLRLMRQQRPQVKHNRLGSGGVQSGHKSAVKGSFINRQSGVIEAKIPFIVEAWVQESGHDEDSAEFYINWTPTISPVYCQRGKRNIFTLVIDNRGVEIPCMANKKQYHVVIHLITPYVPLMSSGKQPDLKPFAKAIVEAISKSAKRFNRNNSSKGSSIKAMVFKKMKKAVDLTSGGSTHIYSQRQLFYKTRELINSSGQTLDYNWFCQIVTEYETRYGELDTMYRDNRGIVYHPHDRVEIPLGTKTVSKYDRPVWKFNKILYCEKEGLFPMLRQSQWPERHDCALFSSKGYASRAARDLIDLLADTEEPITVFCLHDADAAGTNIYRTLQEATAARAARKVKIINLGLEPGEAVAMGLQAETFKQGKKKLPVADYVPEEYRDWLQTHRIELNAMSSPQLIAWLDGKMKLYSGKVIPPNAVLKAQLLANVKDAIRERETTKALAEYGIDRRVEEECERLKKALSAEKRLSKEVEAVLLEKPSTLWAEQVSAIARRIIEKNEKIAF